MRFWGMNDRKADVPYVKKPFADVGKGLFCD